MELLESEANSYPSKIEDVPVEEPESEEPSFDEGGRNWLRIVGLILLAAIIIFLLILLARWIYHSVSHSSTPAITSQTKPQPAAPSGASGVANPSTPGNNTSNTSGKGQTLPNNGPGDVAAIFAGASLAAAGLHYIISVRRFARSDS